MRHIPGVARLIDGETYRQGLALRHGFRDRWEYLFEVTAVAHRGGVFDAFIENWHDTFGLIQGDRDSAPRDRLALFHANGGGTHVHIDRDVSSLGDVSLGVGYSLPRWPLPNDGLAIRTRVKLPTGDATSLAGSGGFAASVWAETSGALPGSADSRTWLYSAALGALAGEAPASFSNTGGRLIVFGRFGVTWRPLTRLSLTAQLDAHSSPYGASGVAPLADPSVMIGLGGALRLTERTTLEIAVTEDDGIHRATPISACMSRKRSAKLSITHKVSLEGGPEGNVVQPGEAAPHDDVAWRRVLGTGEIAAEPGDLDEIERESSGR